MRLYVAFLTLISVFVILFPASSASPISSAVSRARGGIGRIGGMIGRVRRAVLGRGKGKLDPKFADMSSVIGSSAHLTKLETIIDDLTKENEVLRQQGFIYKKNVQYHKDIAARLRREKEMMRQAVETTKRETTEELTKQFLTEKNALVEELQLEFDQKTKAVKGELKKMSRELEEAHKQADRAGSIEAIKLELKEATGRLSESEALVKALQLSIQEKDQLLAQQAQAGAGAGAGGSSGGGPGKKVGASGKASRLAAAAAKSKRGNSSSNEEEGGVRASGSGSGPSKLSAPRGATKAKASSSKRGR